MLNKICWKYPRFEWALYLRKGRGTGKGEQSQERVSYLNMILKLLEIGGKNMGSNLHYDLE